MLEGVLSSKMLQTIPYKKMFPSPLLKAVIHTHLPSNDSDFSWAPHDKTADRKISCVVKGKFCLIATLL